MLRFHGDGGPVAGATEFVRVDTLSKVYRVPVREAGIREAGAEASADPTHLSGSRAAIRDPGEKGLGLPHTTPL